MRLVLVRILKDMMRNEKGIRAVQCPLLPQVCRLGFGLILFGGR